MGLIDDLRPGPVALDTPIFIYFIERDPRFLEIVRPVFSAIHEGDFQGVTSSLTLLEVLVVPYRAGDLPMIDRYEALLTRSQGLRLVDLDRLLLKTAAQLRAKSTMNSPDAIQMAAALVAGCRVLLTNDRKIPSVSGLQVLQLRNYLSTG